MAEKTEETPTSGAETAPTEPSAIETPAVVTQEAFDAMQKALKKANKEAADRRLELDRVAEEQRKANEQRLADEGKHVELAKQREGERDAALLELKAANDRMAQYDALIVAQIETRTAEWPDEVKALIPVEGDALARMQQVQSLEPLAVKLATAPAAGGVRPGPVPGGKAPTMDELKQRKLASSSYPTF